MATLTVSVVFDELHHTVSIIIAENHEEIPELAEELRSDHLEDCHKVLIGELCRQRPDSLYEEEVLHSRILG